MRKFIGLFCALLLLWSPVGMLSVWAYEELELKSQTAVLMDMDTGQVLYSKDMHRRIYPASTTKVLTALVVAENARPYEVVTVNQSAVDTITWDSSHIALTQGEQFTVDSGLYALMLPSANDAANALAEHVAGSQEAFAAMLNARAQEIGALNTHFTNAHGLHDDNHYTTAYDMALITRYAMQNELFRTYFGTPRFTMPPTNKNHQRPFTNYQYQLVRETGYYDPSVLGGKVGYTKEAKHTMTTVAQRGDRTLVCTVMGSPKRGDKFDDTEQLLEFGFSEFIPYSIPRESLSGLQVPVMEGELVVGSATFYADCDYSVLLHNSLGPEDVKVVFPEPQVLTVDSPMECCITIEAPTSPHMVPSLLGEVDLIADVNLSVISTMSQEVEASPSFLETEVIKKAGIAAGGLILILGLLIAYRCYQIRQKRKARLNRLAQRRREAQQRTSYHYYTLSSRPSSGTGRTKIS
jgi:D-alanyl-D-alanine carboxypeptidase (penicillin-binding protein 5/6)